MWKMLSSCVVWLIADGNKYQNVNQHLFTWLSKYYYQSTITNLSLSIIIIRYTYTFIIIKQKGNINAKVILTLTLRQSFNRVRAHIFKLWVCTMRGTRHVDTSAITAYKMASNCKQGVKMS